MSLLAGLCVVAALLSVARSQMQWVEANDSRALCNDFTRAGYFVKRNKSSDKWVIFLESGSLCYSNDTCNRRFFNSRVSDVTKMRTNHILPTPVL